GSAREVSNAEEEGVEFLWKALPKEFKGRGLANEVECIEMKLSDPDDDGRQIPEVIEGSEFLLKSDMIIAALGFSPENLPKLFNEDELPVTRWGTVRVGFDTMMTSIEGVFAAGDIVRGSSLVVWGIRDGREVANSIHNYIEMKKNNSLNMKKVS
ncbi:uncharacterized protein METZ01_LOCUS294725, partial [marine metagenome]